MINYTTLAVATDEELIQLAGEILGREIEYWKEVSSFGYRQGVGGCLFVDWNPLKSLDNAFELADFIMLKWLDPFKLEPLTDHNPPTNFVWLAIFNLSYAEAVDKDRCRAITKASILAWSYWKEKGK